MKFNFIVFLDHDSRIKQTASTIDHKYNNNRNNNSSNQNHNSQEHNNQDNKM